MAYKLAYKLTYEILFGGLNNMSQTLRGGTARDYLEEISEEIFRVLPRDKLEIVDIGLVGAEIVLYTLNPRGFADYHGTLGELAKKLKKRITIRTPNIEEIKRKDENLGRRYEAILSRNRLSKEEAEKLIKSIIPEEAGIKKIVFDETAGKVYIEAVKPGVVIGKGHSNRIKILKETGWVPEIKRYPPIPAPIIWDIREYYMDRNVDNYRTRMLKKLANKIHIPSTWMLKEGKTWVRVTALGGYMEVGRNCHMVTTRDSKVLVDCGVSLGAQPSEMFPDLRVPEFRLDEIDAIVLTHAHLDHSAALLYLLSVFGEEKYEGPIYCTEPTRDLLYLLLKDYVTLSRDMMLQARPEEVLKRIVTVDYGTTLDITPDIRMTFYNAGHILGSSMIHFHIGEGYFNVAFTGDFKYDKRSRTPRLLPPADPSFPRLEALVMETTYGGKRDTASFDDAVNRLKELIKVVYKRKSKLIVPAFVVGRSQEVMFAIRYLRDNKLIPEDIPVYVDGSIWEATAIHTAYPEYLSPYMKRLVYEIGERILDPEVFINIGKDRDKRLEVVNEKGPGVIVTTSGMLNGGPVVEYLYYLGGDKENILAFVGYQAEGTLGRRIQNGERLVKIPVDGKLQTVELKLEVDTVEGFSGHAYRDQLENFLIDLTRNRNSGIKIRKLILHHGEPHKIESFMKWIQKHINIKSVIAPQNLETVRFL